MKENTAVSGKTVCVMIGDVSYDFTTELMRGINVAAERGGVQLFYMTGRQSHIAPTDLRNEQETVSRYNSIYDYTNLVGADAYIISSGSLSGIDSEEAYQQFIRRFDGYPYVLLQKELDAPDPKRCAITIDNYAVYRKCMKHLIEDHHYTKIAFVSGPKHHPEAMERERAYRDAMQESGLQCDESMIEYGDLSGFVDEQVVRLLDAHPDLDAIAFCNDDMAKSGYRVCESRGLIVGMDIAISGFDDFTTGQSMTPPLTTIAQDAYRTGALALQQAVLLAEGKPAKSIKLETRLVLRASCGCHQKREMPFAEGAVPDANQYIQTMIAHIQEDLTHAMKKPELNQYQNVTDKLIGRIQTLALENQTQLPEERAMDAWLIPAASQLGVHSGLVAERLHQVLMQMSNTLDHPRVKRFFQIVLYVQGFLFQFETRETAKRIEAFRTQAWFAPEFIRDLVVIVDEDERVYLNVVNKLRSIGLRNLYICLLPEPQIRRETQAFQHGGRLHLAAYLADGNAVTYPTGRMPVIDEQHPMRTLKDLPGNARMISFSIFSGDMQFGVCLCETDRDSNPLMHIIGLQLGILMNFLDLKRREQIVAREIEHVQKRNEELNYLSEYDTLCNVYNRRGFIEQAMRLNQRNAGKQAFLVFADLDHLKKINDNFGHAAGDDAIRAVSTVLKQVIRGGDLIARIGGDEFVGMFIADSSNFRDHFEQRVREAIETYNRDSGKPYYVGVSVGLTDFTCKPDLEIGKIIDKADQYLYQAKKHKRDSIMK